MDMAEEVLIIQTKTIFRIQNIGKLIIIEQLIDFPGRTGLE